ncbi:MAG: hypothetical protein ACFFBP_10255 [Promethearchaeota archaeon]
MIGEYIGVVNNKVVTALLTAYHEVLDYDGLKSILREANMLHLRDIKNIDPNKTMDFFSFKKIITAQNILLYECNSLLETIGEKFSFYLFPFGKNFKEIIKEINELIQTDWNVEIIESTAEEIQVKVQKCIFCSEVGVSCDFFKGFLTHSLTKTLQSDMKVQAIIDNENAYDPDHYNFILKLKINKE